MPSPRSALSCLLALGLAVAGAATLPVSPASADTGTVSAIAVDSLGQDGLSISSNSFHSPAATITATTAGGNGYRLVSSSTSPGSLSSVTITPPTGSAFVGGTTYDLARFADATHASVGPLGATCPMEGSLTVDDIAVDPTDAHLTSLTAGFTLRCVGSSSYLFSTLRYLSSAGYSQSGQFTSITGIPFGTVPVGQASAARTFTVVSWGTSPVTFGTAAVTGTFASDFTISNDTCSGATVASGSTCSLALTATPSTVGGRVVHLTIPDNGLRGLRDVAASVSGYGAPFAPTGVSASTTDDGVLLSWNQSAPNGSVGAATYQVFRGTTEADLAPFPQTTGLQYGDAVSGTTVAGTPYVYAVAGINTAGTGPSSAAVTGTTPAEVTVPTSTRLITADVESPTSPYAQAGRVMSGAGVTASSAYGFQINTNVPANAYYGEALWIHPPTGVALASGSYPLAGTADATHATAEIRTPEGASCLLSDGTLDVVTYTRSSTGAVSRADLDVSGTCSSGATGSASVRYGVDRDYAAASVSGGDGPRVPVGQAHSVTSTYTNTGTRTIHLSSVAVTAPGGGTSTDWVLGSTDCTGAALSPGSSCTASATGTPSAAGDSLAAAITFSSDIGPRTRGLTVSGITAPVAPSVFGGYREGGKLTLNWNDAGSSTQRATTFEVFRGTSDADLHLVATVAASTVYSSGNWTDPDTSNGNRYYAVRSVNAAGSSPMTAMAFDLALRAPTNLYGTSTSRAAYLAWVTPTGTPADPITEYAVYRGTTVTSLTKVATVTGTSATLPAIPAGTHAYFAVAAITASGNSPSSTTLDVLGPTSQLVVAGTDANYNPTVSVRPLTGVPLATPVVSDGQVHGDVAVSPNGVLVAYTSGSSTDDLYVRRVDGTGTPIALATTAADEYSPAWSPDGKYLAYSKVTGNVYVICKVAATGGASTCSTWQGVVHPSWLNSTTLVVTDISSATAPLATMTFTSMGLTPLAGTEGGYEPSVSPDGKKIAYVAALSDTADVARVYTLATHAVVSLPSPSSTFIGTPSWTRDSLSVYYAGNSQNWSKVYHSQADGSGALSSVSSQGLVFGVSVSTPDTTAPTSVKLGGVPAYALGTSVTPTFSAADTLNGVSSYTVSYRRAAFNGAFGAPATVTLTAPRAIAVARGYTYCFSVRATDRVGNTSAATAEQCTVVPLDDRSLARSSAFAPITNAAYYASTAMRTSTRGATLTRTGMIAARQLYLVATTCSTCGTVDVYVGSARVGSVNLHGVTSNRHVFALPAFSARSGTITVKVTSTGKPVIIDGLGVRK